MDTLTFKEDRFRLRPTAGQSNAATGATVKNSKGTINLAAAAATTPAIASTNSTVTTATAASGTGTSAIVSGRNPFITINETRFLDQRDMDTNNNNNNNNNNDNEDDSDDDDEVIFIKEQPVSAFDYNYNYNYNYNFNYPPNTISATSSTTTTDRPHQLLLPTTDNSHRVSVSSSSSSSSASSASASVYATPSKHHRKSTSSSFSTTATTNNLLTKRQRTVSLPQLSLARLPYDFYTDSLTYIPKLQTDEELLRLTGSSSLTISSNKMVSLKLLKPLEAPGLFKTDTDGHYIYQKGDIFGDLKASSSVSNDSGISSDDARGKIFTANKLLGQGTFGKVLRCSVTTTSSSTNSKIDSSSPQVAVKIIRAVDRYREAAKTELRILSTIARHDPTGYFQCLVLSDCFDYKNHICLVTPLYGKSVYDFMCANGIARFPGSHIQAISRQLLRSVTFLHDLNIIHTDIKPENILLCDDTSYTEYQLPQATISTLSKRRRVASNGGKRKILDNPEIKLIDFGSAIFYNEYHPPVISTRHYRAPEIVLGLNWSFPCDIWSVGCVLAELVLGESLYPIHNNYEHLVMMQRINGCRVPRKLVDMMFCKVESGSNSQSVMKDLEATVLPHFDRRSGILVWPEVDASGACVDSKVVQRIMRGCSRLDNMVLRILRRDLEVPELTLDWNLGPEENWQRNAGVRSVASAIDKETYLFWYWFVDLLRLLFEFDPTKRITAREALDHEWFNYGILDEGIN